MEEWRNSPENPRNNPKLTPERAKQIADEAIAGGQKWDVQEQINARRKAEIQAECGGGLGKLTAPAKFDAAIPVPRCQVGEGAFGTYFVHPSKQYGVKLFKDADANADHEIEMLNLARRAGVNCPEVLGFHALIDRDGDVRSQTMILSHMDGYNTLQNTYGTAANAPLITRVKLAREFRKLHMNGLAHGDIHGKNVLINPRTKQPALVDFGYATHLDDFNPTNQRTGIENLWGDLHRLPTFLDIPGKGNDFLYRYEGVIKNIEKQASEWVSGFNRANSWNRLEVGIKRYHDALESELLYGDRRPRSRFISGAEQLRIPGLTRRILTAQANTAERQRIEQFVALPSLNLWRLKKEAKKLNAGIKPARLLLALNPERDARLARLPSGFSDWSD